MLQETYITSSDKKDRLHVCSWMPAQETDLIVQITHGMAEHIGRYSEFAEYLNQHGIGVIGHDTLGHGKSVENSSQLGFFSTQDGDRWLVQDIYRVNCLIRKKYPGCRIVLLGHSMGSFVARSFLTMHSEKVEGAILLGTGNQSRMLLFAGALLNQVIRIARGNFYRSELMNYLMLDSNNRYFADDPCKSWLSCSEEEVLAYQTDALCGFRFTACGYRDFFRILKRLSVGKGTKRIGKRLPILLASGEDDPIGNFGKGVRAVYDGYQAAGIRDVSLHIYPGMRHELLHEREKERIFQEIYEWLKNHFD